MKKIIIIFFLIFPLFVCGTTIRGGIEGPALLGITFEANNGLYISLGASPPLSIFGSGGPWSFSVSGGYANPIVLSMGKNIDFITVPRIGVGIIKPENTYVGIIPGLLGAFAWKIKPDFSIGFQAGLNICILLEINSMEPNLIPVGQFGIFARF